MPPAPYPEITRATQAYYDPTAALSHTAIYFYYWLDALPPARQAQALKSRYSLAQHLDFLRYCLKRRGFFLLDFMAAHQSLTDLAQWGASAENRQASAL